MGAYTYSTTAASNTSIDGLGNNGLVDPPSNIDNLVGRLAASQAALVRDLGGANTSVGGTADAITVSLADPTNASAYFDGMVFSFRAASDTTVTNPTLQVDGISGPKTIKKAIQGVESDLVIGDIQAGQTCQVVYRSAWATAAGAFELLNPSIASSIEVGHATDATLTRAEAGVLAVEGKRVLTRTHGTSLSTSSGSSWGFTSIPSWVREIDVFFYSVSLNGSDNLLIQLGTSGGYEATGYVGQSTIHNASGNTEYTPTTGFGIILNNAARAVNGKITLASRDNSNTSWICTGVYMITDATNYWTGTVSGRKDVSAALDRVQVTVSGGNTGDAVGAINISYR